MLLFDDVNFVETNDDSIWEGAEVISEYSRAQALEDGILCDLSDNEVTKEHFKYPVACTTAVWDIIDKAVKNKRAFNDLNGVLHDIFHMSKSYFKEIDATTRIFPVIITGAGRKRKFEFKLVCGPGDDGAPVMTLMFSHED